MRYLVACIGAVLIFFCAFILTAIIFGMLGLTYPISLFGIHTNNPFGFIFSTIASTASYRATLRRAKERDLDR
jgi:hypothetical protein